MQTDEQTDRQNKTEPYRYTDRPTDKQAGGQTETHSVAAEQKQKGVTIVCVCLGTAVCSGQGLAVSGHSPLTLVQTARLSQGENNRGDG